MWVLFWHAESDCYWWVKDPTGEDYEGDGLVTPVTDVIEHHFISRDVHRVPWPEGWVDPLI